MKRSSLLSLKFGSAILAAVLLWLAPFGRSESTALEAARPELEIFPLVQRLIQALPGDASAACAPSCMEEVCLAWVPIGGSCQPTNPWDIGCCTLYGSVCNEELPGCGPEEPPPPPVYSPPTISAVKVCTTYGPSGWCLQDGSIRITASDPQGFGLTISGIQNGMGLNTPFACTSPCVVSMLPGSGFVTFSATADTSGLSSSQGSILYSFDPTPPLVSHTTSGPRNGGWYTSALAHESITISDSISGMQSSSVTLNGAAASNYFPLLEGANNISITARDLAGNQNVVSYVVQKDSVKPVLSLDVTGIPNGTWYKSATVSISASDATSGVQSLVITDNGASVSSPMALSEGTHTIVATASDRAGLVQSQSLTVRVDGTPPSITPSFSGKAGENGWYTSNVIVSLNALDSGSGLQSVQLALDGGPLQPYTTPLTLGEGRHELQFVAEDQAGNRRELLHSVLVDTTAPDLRAMLDGSEGRNGWFVSVVQAGLEAADAISGIATLRYRLDGGAWRTGSMLNVDEDGEHVLDMQAMDTAGNSVQIQRSFRIDSSPPQISLTPFGQSGSNGWYVSNVGLETLASDAMSGLLHAEYSLDDGSWLPLVAAVSLKEGRHGVQVRATDLAGNQSAAAILIKVDTTPPTAELQLEGKPGSNGWYVSEVRADLQVSDATSGPHTLRLSDHGQDASALPLVLQDGVHVLEYTVVDEAGNSTRGVEQLVQVDATPPLLRIDSPAPNSLAIGRVPIRGQAADQTSGLQAVQISFDGSAWIPLAEARADWSYEWDTSILPNGPMTFHARSLDRAGNPSESARLDLVLDNQPPGISLTDSWNIWESGQLIVRPNGIPLASVKIVIHDPLLRYPDLVYFEDDHSPGDITWDRGIGNVKAPPGEYQVKVQVCDLYGLCSRAEAVIHIPRVEVSSIPTPLLFPPDQDRPARIPAETILLPNPPSQPLVASAVSVQAVPHPEGVLWPALLMFVVLLMLAGQLLLDPRPAALSSLQRTLSPMTRSRS